jgi:transposase, IS30 family
MASSKPANNNIVLAERKTRFILARRRNDKTARTAAASIRSFQAPWSKEMFLSIAYDNGSEFTNHGHVSGCAYFCGAHSPWQKGTVENTIGRLRRDLQRKTQKQDYSDADFDDIIFMHNNIPRKCLHRQLDSGSLAVKTGDLQSSVLCPRSVCRFGNACDPLKFCIQYKN